MNAPTPEPNSEIKPREFILDQVIETILNIWAILFGLGLIVYGVLADVFGDSFEPFEIYADWLSTFSTLLSVFLLIISIYWTTEVKRPVEFRSKFYGIIIISMIVFFVFHYVVCLHRNVPTFIVLGFANLGLAGTLFRTISFGRHTKWNQKSIN